jgi:hypothetical protein
MARYNRATKYWKLLFSFFFISSVTIALPAFGDDKKVSDGCTMTQLRSPQGTRCIEKGARDLIGNRPSHVLLCLGSDMKCCTTDTTTSGQLSFHNCEDLGSMTPPPNLTCAEIKLEKGVWTPDPKTIKADADKKTCSQIYTCNAPSELPPIVKAVNCKAVVSVSHKQVTQSGKCVGTNCGSCSSNPPSDPCSITFTR